VLKRKPILGYFDSGERVEDTPPLCHQHYWPTNSITA
jgi:hypothetical protein